jgi:hypothetical protein
MSQAPNIETGATTIHQYNEYKIIWTALSNTLDGANKLVSRGISDDLKTTLIATVKVVSENLIMYNRLISDFQKKCEHRWKAVYRCDGETHGVCQICDSNEWVPSRSCSY